MATIATAKLGVLLKFDNGNSLLVRENDILTNIVYRKGKIDATLDEGRVRVICARTTAQTGGPTDCPPEPYTQNFITPTQLIIDYSDENYAKIERINVADLVSIDSAASPEEIEDAATITVGGENSEYKTLSAAIAALERGDIQGTIKMEEDVCENLTIKGDVTIDLNGHTLSVPEVPTNDPYNHNFYVDGGTLTINGEGVIENPNNQGYCVFNAGPSDNWTPGRVPSTSMGQGTVVINGGTFRHTGADKEHHGYLIVNHGAMMTINGGEYSMAYDDSSLITNGFQSDPSTSPIMVINGGKFTGGRHTLNNDHGGRLTVNGGEFVMGTPWEGQTTGPKNVLRNEDTATATVKDGNFTGNVENSNAAEKSLQISGGTFSVDVTAYLAEGCKQNSTTGEVTK